MSVLLVQKNKSEVNIAIFRLKVYFSKGLCMITYHFTKILA